MKKEFFKQRDLEAYSPAMTLRWMDSQVIFDRWAASFNLTLSEIWVLLVLSIEDGPVHQNKIVTETGLPKQTVSYVIGKLVRKGHIVQTVEHEDRRARMITMTQEGRNFFASILAETNDVGRRSMAIFTMEERMQFFNLHKFYMDELMAAFSECMEKRQKKAGEKPGE